MTKGKDWAMWMPEKNNVLPLDAHTQGVTSNGQQGKVPPSPAAPVSLIKDRLQTARLRAMQALETWLPVSLVAKDWGVSARRVRILLEAERLTGRKGDNGYWEVKFPYSIIAGTRGPASRREVKKVERMQERTK